MEQTDEQINKVIAEYMGLCWHEYDQSKPAGTYDDDEWIYCKHCSINYAHTPNPDYCNDMNSIMEVVEKLFKEDKWWCELGHQDISGMWFANFEKDDEMFGELSRKPAEAIARAVVKVIQESQTQ